MSKKSTTTLSNAKVFHIRNSLRNLLTLFIILLAVFAIGFASAIPSLLSNPDDDTPLAVATLSIFAILSALGAWLLYRIAYQSFIAVSPEGIQFNVNGSSGTTTWSNLHSIDKFTSSSGYPVLWVILTHKPMQMNKNTLFRIFNLFGRSHITVSTEHYIPLQSFAEGNAFNLGIGSFRQTPLGMEIAKHAPQLFATTLHKEK